MSLQCFSECFFHEGLLVLKGEKNSFDLRKGVCHTCDYKKHFFVPNTHICLSHLPPTTRRRACVLENPSIMTTVSVIVTRAPINMMDGPTQRSCGYRPTATVKQRSCRILRRGRFYYRRLKTKAEESTRLAFTGLQNCCLL